MCKFCAEKIDYINYKDVRLLAPFLPERGKIQPRRALVRVASARPFVPETPSRAIRGEIPMPEGRPYSLGHTPQDLASINATSEMSASRRNRGPILGDPRPVSYETDDRYAPGLRPSVAYAPVDPRGPSEIISGRGLY